MRNSEPLPSQQFEIYPKIGPLFEKDHLSKSNVTPAFQIPTPPASPQKQKPIRVIKVKITPRSSSVTTNSNSPGDHDIEALSRLINKRSQRGRKLGLFEKSVDDEIFDKENEFFRTLPSRIPRIVLLGPAAIFQNGQSLKSYQAVDLAILLRRERGERVCGTDTVNNVGYILAYEMGFVGFKQYGILLLKVMLDTGRQLRPLL